MMVFLLVVLMHSRPQRFEVILEKVAQDDLIDFVNKEQVVGVLVRSATTVRQNVVDSCPILKLIGRGGVGMDNIDGAYAREKGLTKQLLLPAASQSCCRIGHGTSVWWYRDILYASYRT